MEIKKNLLKRKDELGGHIRAIDLSLRDVYLVFDIERGEIDNILYILDEEFEVQKNKAFAFLLPADHIIDLKRMEMYNILFLMYGNGDQWFLMREALSERVLVQDWDEVYHSEAYQKLGGKN